VLQPGGLVTPEVALAGGQVVALPFLIMGTQTAYRCSGPRPEVFAMTADEIEALGPAFALLALLPCLWLPDYKPGEIPGGQPPGK
jgi:hypothetical protein